MSVSPEDIRGLARACPRKIRIHAVEMTRLAKSSHVASSMSMAEILAVLYRRILQVRPEVAGRRRPRSADPQQGARLRGAVRRAGRMRILSRSSGSTSFYIDGAQLPGHATPTESRASRSPPDRWATDCRSPCGMALAAKRDGSPHRVFAVLSDGECDEGSNWEADSLRPPARTRQSRGHRRLQQNPEPRPASRTCWTWSRSPTSGGPFAGRCARWTATTSAR